jgi:RNA polymerase-binding transcription factor DksA
MLRVMAERERMLREHIAERRGALDEAALPAEDALDEADLAFKRDRQTIEHDLIDLSLRELAQIEAARARIEAGRYGECQDCGEAIEARRLEANPVALRCAACQSHHERLFATAN